MENLDTQSQKHFSIIYHLFNPLIASLITFLFLWLLKDLLLLDFFFNNITRTIIGFLILILCMILISWYLPQNQSQ